MVKKISESLMERLNNNKKPPEKAALNFE